MRLKRVCGTHGCLGGVAWEEAGGFGTYNIPAIDSTDDVGTPRTPRTPHQPIARSRALTVATRMPPHIARCRIAVLHQLKTIDPPIGRTCDTDTGD